MILIDADFLLDKEIKIARHGGFWLLKIISTQQAMDKFPVF